jgi:Tat protein translocase TatB subunit
VFSVSPAEILTIAVIALLVFGPRRLPEIARKAGKVIRDMRSAADELKTGLEREYGEVVGPLTEATEEVRSALDGPVSPLPAEPAADEADDPEAAEGDER